MTEQNAPERGAKPVKPELRAFADWLVRRMKERRIKNNQLAQKLGVSTGAISEYRRAMRRPREDAQTKLAAVFGDEPEDVYRLLEQPTSFAASLTSADVATGLAVIDEIRAYLDTLAARLAVDATPGADAASLDALFVEARAMFRTLSPEERLPWIDEVRPVVLRSRRARLATT